MSEGFKDKTASEERDVGLLVDAVVVGAIAAAFYNNRVGQTYKI